MDMTWTPKNADHWIEPGTETLSDRLNAIRALALTVEAAESEIGAMNAKELSDGVAKYETHDMSHFDDASDRAIDAGDALALEIEDAERNGLLGQLSALSADTSGNPVVEAVDAFVQLGEAKGFDLANTLLAMFLPDDKIEFGHVSDIPKSDLADFVRACRAEARAKGRRHD